MYAGQRFTTHQGHPQQRHGVPTAMHPQGPGIQQQFQRGFMPNQYQQQYYQPQQQFHNQQQNFQQQSSQQQPQPPEGLSNEALKKRNFEEQQKKLKQMSGRSQRSFSVGGPKSSLDDFMSKNELNLGQAAKFSRSNSVNQSSSVFGRYFISRVPY